MQITIDIKESAVDKILYLLKHLKDDVTILEEKEGTLADRVRESEEDIRYGRVEPIGDIDKHIESLKDAIE